MTSSPTPPARDAPSSSPTASSPATSSAAPAALAGPVMMQQSWVDVGFLHWAVEPERVAHLMPAGTRPDVLDGRAYVGLIPFRMVGAAPGRLPGTPWLGTFWETNVRLYSVDDQGRRGVVFLSLDADRLGVVLGARLAFGLPYRWARMAGSSYRDVEGARSLTWTARTRWPSPGRTSRLTLAVGDPLPPDAPDAALAEFVTARYGLHSAHAGRRWWIANEHAPWPLHRARVVALDDQLLAAAGFPDLAGRAPDHVAFAPEVFTRFALPRTRP